MSLKLLIVQVARDVAEVVAFGARLNWPSCEITIAASGEEAMRHFVEEEADLVVLGVSMPHLDGFEVCRRIRELSQVPILMLSTRDGTLDKVRALDLGADDYLTKPFDHLELMARLRALVRRSNAALVTPDVDFAVSDLAVDFATREVRVRGKLIKLTSTEYRLLEELVRNAGTVRSHRSLLEQVWGAEYARDVSYLKVFVRRLRQKLGDDAGHPRYIQTEWGIGYRFTAPV